MSDAAINLEALAETLERAASELRLAAQEKRKRAQRMPTPARVVEESNVTDLDQERARRAIERLNQRRGQP